MLGPFVKNAGSIIFFVTWKSGAEFNAMHRVGLMVIRLDQDAQKATRRKRQAAFAGAHDREEHPRLFTTEFSANVARLNQCSEALSVNTSMRVPCKFDTGIVGNSR